MTDINTWAAVDDNNNNTPPAGWPEGQMPSTVNNTARAMMGSLKRWRDQSQPMVTSTGSANAQVLTYAVAPATLQTGDVFCFSPGFTNTASPTLTINGQGPYTIRNTNYSSMIGGELIYGAAIMVYYLAGEGFRVLTASMPLSISNGGTGVTTPGAAADAIGAVKDTGDTMTGQLTVPNISYSGMPGGIGNHAFQLGWDGANAHIYVDGVDTGVVGDITSLAAGNGLIGGGSSGALTLSMSGGYGGNFNATGSITAGTDLYAVNIHAASGNLTAGALGILGNSSLGGNTYTHNVLAYSDNAASVGLPGAAYSGMWAYGYTTVSDQSVKGDIQPLPPGSLDLVQAIPPHTYVMLTGPDQTTRHAGFVAQEVNEALLAAGHVGGYVLDRESGVAGLNYDELLAILWGAVQTLTARVDSLQAVLAR